MRSVRRRLLFGIVEAIKFDWFASREPSKFFSPCSRSGLEFILWYIYRLMAFTSLLLMCKSVYCAYFFHTECVFIWLPHCTFEGMDENVMCAKVDLIMSSAGWKFVITTGNYYDSGRGIEPGGSYPSLHYHCVESIDVRVRNVVTDDGKGEQSGSDRESSGTEDAWVSFCVRIDNQTFR